MITSDEIVTTAIRRWLYKVVIGLNFCPFAKREVLNNRVRISVCRQATDKQALSTLLDEVYRLEEDLQIATTLLVFPQGFKDFSDYLDLLSVSEQLLEQSGYCGIYQLASFHPDYVFDGSEIDDAANYTNRAPFPILHILREQQLSDALSRYPNPESIPLNNINKARELGAQHMSALLRACID